MSSDHRRPDVTRNRAGRIPAGSVEIMRRFERAVRIELQLFQPGIQPNRRDPHPRRRPLSRPGRLAERISRGPRLGLRASLANRPPPPQVRCRRLMLAPRQKPRASHERSHHRGQRRQRDPTAQPAKTPPRYGIWRASRRCRFRAVIPWRRTRSTGARATDRITGPQRFETQRTTSISRHRSHGEWPYLRCGPNCWWPFSRRQLNGRGRLNRRLGWIARRRPTARFRQHGASDGG